MNLWFRMARIFLISKFAKQIALLDESRIAFRVWPLDCDINMHMNNGRYLTLMDLGRTYFMAQMDMLWKLPKKKWFPVVGAVEIKYYRSLNPFQRFEIVSRVLTWDEKWIYLEQRFEAEGKVFAAARLRALFIGPKGRVSTDDVIRLTMDLIPEPPMDAVIGLWAGEK
jgi:acyl-CoA thioesterase FadM